MMEGICSVLIEWYAARCIEWSIHLYNVSTNTNSAQNKKWLLTRFVLPLDSNTVSWGQVPCTLDERLHHWHLHHHQLSSQARRLRLESSNLRIKMNDTFFSNINFQIVLTRSFPIIMPVCLPMVELNLIRWLFKVQRLSFPGGEWMYMMLTEVYGRRLRVDQPSQTRLIFEFIAWINVNQRMEKIEWDTYFYQLNCNIIQFLDFGVHCIHHAGFLRNGFILNFRVQVGDEPLNRWTFNKAKWLSRNIIRYSIDESNVSYQVTHSNNSKKVLFYPLLCNQDQLFGTYCLLRITHDQLLFKFHGTEINRFRHDK